MLSDLRQALTQIARRPGFTVVAVMTLALGVGANTAVFSAVYSVLLAKPPFPRSEELTLLTQTFVSPGGESDTRQDWSYPEYRMLREFAPNLVAAAYTPYALSYNLATSDEPAPVRVEIVSADYFDVLGVSALEGRTFAPSEDATPGTHPVAMIGHRAWRSAFGGDPSLVGRTIRLNGVTLEVVGVMPPGFTGLSGAADLWVPMMMAPTLVFRNRLEQPRALWHSVVARVPEDATALAGVELASAAQAISGAFASSFGVDSVALGTRSLDDVRVDWSFGRPLLILLAAVACVLLIACGNLANLLLARGVRRTRELGLRVALGASPRRLLQQSLAEAAVLCVLGGGAAILVAVWGLALVRWLDPGVLSAPETAGVLGLSVPVLAFNWAVAILAALVFSMAPALAATRSDARTLMSGTRPRRGRVGPRGILVVAEVALATVLLVGAGLLLRSFDRLQATPIGFRPDNVFAAYVNVPTQAYSADEAASLLMEATRQIAARPGVEQAALANCLPANPSVGPLSGQCDQVGMRIRGAATDVEHDVWMNMVSAGYFSALGIPVLEGRAFDEGDSADAPRSAVVTESAASRYWPGRDPLGAYIQLSAGSDDWAEVVGVVGDAIGASRRELPEPGVYLSYPQLSYHSNYVVVRAATDPRPIASLVRSVLRELDPALPLWDVGTMEERLNRVTARDRFSTVLLGAFGVLALLLAAVGVYGVLAFLVAERIREVSIRLAIGATRRDVSTLVLRKGLYLTLLGLGIGIVAAAVVTRVLQTQLYAVSPLDPLTFVTAAIVLVAVAGVACYLPCRRAARVDPMATLRHE